MTDGLVSYAEAVLTARSLSASRVDRAGRSNAAAYSSVSAVSAVTSSSVSPLGEDAVGNVGPEVLD